jgi:hypothetical protein
MSSRASGKQRVSKKSWQSLLGELRLHWDSRQPRSLLHPPAGPVEIRRVRVTPVKSHLESFERLVRDLTERLTRLGKSFLITSRGGRPR